MNPGVYVAVESGNLIIWYPPNGDTQMFEYYRNNWKSEVISYFSAQYLKYTIDYELICEL